MKFQWGAKALWIVGLAAAAGIFIGCHVGDDITNIPVTQVQGQGNTGASPSPSPGSSQGIVAVRVSTFGTETCQGGGSPSSDPNTVAVGCIQPVTCTPLLPGDVQAPAGTHQAAPDSFEIVSGGASGELRAVENPFNGDLVGTSPGTVKLRCTVGGLHGDLDVAVVQ